MTGVGSIFLRLDAPISAWRWLQAGVYRGTFPVIPPSAAWGLLLNLAGIETRGTTDETVTPIRADAPLLDIAVGVERPGDRATLYQQLHSYPVGTSGAEFKKRAHGQKYWIAPVRREILVGLVATVGARGDADIIDRAVRGLRGELGLPRYGLPFAGDNQFLFSRIDIVQESVVARWYTPVVPGEQASQTTRLTTNIDRIDAARTQAPLFAPGEPGPCPATAWVRIGPTRVGADGG